MLKIPTIQEKDFDTQGMIIGTFRHFDNLTF